ncbi:MAG: GNAT family N-acetyltransferase [Thermoplasmata archaeon]
MARMIREAGEEDIPEISELELMSLEPVWEREDIVPDRGSLKKFLVNGMEQGHRLVVMEDGGYISGFLHSVGYRDVITNDDIREIISLVVHPEHFGEGIGGELIENERLFCRSQGVALLKLEVLSSNQRGISFYRKHGFREIKKVMIRDVEKKEG